MHATSVIDHSQTYHMKSQDKKRTLTLLLNIHQAGCNC